MNAIERHLHAHADPAEPGSTAALREVRQALAQSQARNGQLFTGSPLPMIVFNSEDLHIMAINPACTGMLGYAAEQWLGQPLAFAVEAEAGQALSALAREQAAHADRAAHTGRLRWRHSAGHWLESDGTVQRFDYPGCRAQLLVLQEAGERRLAEERLRLAAKEHRQQLELTEHYDALTGLPGRALFSERIRQGFVQAEQTHCSIGICYLDIDAFGVLNANYGREVADHLLINTAECLRACLRGGDTLARIGSDEFALLVVGVKNDNEITQFLQDLQERLSEPFVSDTLRLKLTASIGVTVYPQDDADPDTLLRHADQAMMVAKQAGPGHYRRYDPENDRRVRAQRENIEIMRTALARREFVLHYQPKVDLKRRRVVGAEALIRWRHPERGILPPGTFLPAIESNRLIVDLGYWVIDEALTQMDRWRGAGLDLPVSVNIAARQLAEPDFVPRLSELLSAHPETRAGQLEIEILESSELRNIGTVEQIIVACRALGVGFSLDDFGTGYSSLTYLRRLSADTLKIDQSFVRQMLDDPEDKAIVSGVIGLARAFQRQVIAEGVETIAQARSLMALGCVLAQGYGIARPMPPEAMVSWVAAWPDAAWMALGE